MADTQKITLKLSPQARRYASPDAPLEARSMAARGALPLPPVELATVLFALLHDPDAEIKATARESLDGLPRDLTRAVLSGEAHPALLAHLAHVHRDDAELMEELAEYQPDLFVVYSGNNEFLEKRTYGKLLDEPVLLSAAFADCIPDQYVSLGRHSLKGINEPQEIFALRAVE